MSFVSLMIFFWFDSPIQNVERWLVGGDDKDLRVDFIECSHNVKRFATKEEFFRDLGM